MASPINGVDNIQQELIEHENLIGGIGIEIYMRIVQML